MTALPLEFIDEVSIVTPEAQNALVEIFRVLERVGGKAPSNGVVFAAARGCDIAFPDGEAKTLLAHFRKARPGGAPRSLPVRTALAPGIEHERPALAPESLLPSPDDAGATRARDKVLLVPKLGEGDDGDVDDAPIDRSAKSDGYEFGVWFFGAMFAAKIDSARAVYPGATGLALEPANLQASIALTATHGMDQCKVRARRMFDRKNRSDQHRLMMRVSPAKLLEHWEMFASDDVARAAAATPTTAFGDSYADASRRRLELLK